MKTVVLIMFIKSANAGGLGVIEFDNMLDCLAFKDRAAAQVDDSMLKSVSMQCIEK